MSAELLREAASLMRRRAMAAESGMAGPWFARILTDGRAWMGGEVDALSLHGYPSVAEHSASWHPVVTIAVTDWLEVVASYGEPEKGHGTRNWDAAVAVARAYLGEQP